MILNEEKATKYFHSQEKQKQLKKSINKLIDNEDNILQNKTDILNECKKFYQNLYNKQKTCQTTQNQFLQNLNSKISENQIKL